MQSEKMSENKEEYWRLQKEANLSNTQAAKYLGVNKSTVVRWRNGQSEVPKAVILALSAYVEKIDGERKGSAYGY